MLKDFWTKMGVHEHGCTLHSWRQGAATHSYLKHQALEKTVLDGRWSCARVAQDYSSEAAVALADLQLGQRTIVVAEFGEEACPKIAILQWSRTASVLPREYWIGPSRDRSRSFWLMAKGIFPEISTTRTDLSGSSSHCVQNQLSQTAQCKLRHPRSGSSVRSIDRPCIPSIVLGIC